MQRYRFDDKRILTEAIVELLNQGIEPEDLDLVLSRIGPVDLDLMQECLIEVWNYNHPELAATQMAA
ncbi:MULTISPECIES: hypothetical protein [Brucella]|uniref:Uncharacterized protein n=14 Tax=Brucella TaxID=234 RepID=Q2YPL4_BRUA2|nr:MULTISPECIES: hypothetical protein [Brucella]EPZ75840.1 hypothetical protein M798_07920 [Brucella melitensis ADMAS-G1]ERM85667.1 hypothetical protein P865_12585 [Brucella abortus 82]ERT86015.1 hypothetical protein P050_01194 [Brucella abortus 90-12178]ERT97076.1 hypothetical protein P038_03024 [Brucella abortus 99-9971-135]ERU00237.1 hypothetical protein P039_03036 [Brucella abortus 07-0994-2411]EXU84224.1 hypothetical protein AX23_16880 [Brucella melitensis 548]KFH21438.1 hypothetical pr